MASIPSSSLQLPREVGRDSARRRRCSRRTNRADPRNACGGRAGGRITRRGGTRWGVEDRVAGASGCGRQGEIRGGGGGGEERRGAHEGR